MISRWKQKQMVTALWVVLGLAVAVAAMNTSISQVLAADADPASAESGPTTGSAADEKGIRATADAFVAAFNAGDAKAIGAMWATDAEYTDESGNVFHGRAEIEKEYADLFKEKHGLTIALTIESIRFLGPDIAAEKGIAKVKSAGGDAESAARYSVIHARRGGKWVMVVGRDAPYVSASNEDYLKDLEWLIGDWRMDAKDRNLRIRFEWMAQRNFIKNTYIATKDGKESLTGGQIIGWDPRKAKIVSWHFDAQGGFGHDVWTKDGTRWVIDATGIFRNGSDSTAVNVITPIDANAFTWMSIKRTLDGVSLPNTGPVKIVRIQAEK
ncbi:MAG: SgcJ/EcaC family oxidoreductase [Planctomycetia bacterium]|nr:SgcJ/EcaC family oxidoreductase [Planctomycetia bacterium]